MDWTKNLMTHIVADLAEENYFACYALYKIASIEFTDKVETLAVTMESNPVLLINKTFIDKYADTEYDIKALLLHEFLHVILGHTEKYKYNTPLLNIALDAIINSIIHRTCGDNYSGFFSKFYKWENLTYLLRPEPPDHRWISEGLDGVHISIYDGDYGADDLHELLVYWNRSKIPKLTSGIVFVGDHDFANRIVSEENEELLNRIVSKMKGTGIWTKPELRGIGSNANKEEVLIQRKQISNWETDTSSILRKCFCPDKIQVNSTIESIVYLPLLNGKDRKAFSRYTWSGIIPFCENITTVNCESETASVYLDVSGSMEKELESLIGLLNYFRKHIRMPLWVFSNNVYPATFKDGKLIYESTGGTSIACVFDHIRKSKVHKNLIVTDGYIEVITNDMLQNINKPGIIAIVSSGGNPSLLESVSIKCHMLKQI